MYSKLRTVDDIYDGTSRPCKDEIPDRAICIRPIMYPTNVPFMYFGAAMDANI